MNSAIAECVGLWLAEGDNKTKSEITFTNNQFGLIKHFYYTVIKLYSGAPRIYTYSKNKDTGVDLENCRIKYYADFRARKPYYILRLASVEAVRDWREKVKHITSNRYFYPDILRGFFAGEGSVKPSNRSLRISQKEPNKLVEKMLSNLNITYKFTKSNRTYEISGKWNWDTFASYNLAGLHPEKKDRFWKSYNTYKEIHFPNFKLKHLVLNELIKPSTAKGLAIKFNRSQARICDVLMALKKEGNIKNFRIGSKDYWTNKDIILISKVKQKYLALLSNECDRTFDFARRLHVTWKSSHKRLKELEKLGVVNFKNGYWHPNNNMTTICGVDEAGNNFER